MSRGIKSENDPNRIDEYREWMKSEYIQIMIARAMFIMNMSNQQVKDMHKIERDRVGYHCTWEIAGKKFKQLDVKYDEAALRSVYSLQWSEFKRDVQRMAPYYNEEYGILDYLHKWDWNIFKNMKLSDYSFNEYRTQAENNDRMKDRKDIFD